MSNILSIAASSAAILGTLINSFGWNRHARQDDRRFAQIHRSMQGEAETDA